MRRLVFTAASALLLIAALVGFPGSPARAQGQVLIPAEALQSDLELRQVLNDGAELERAGRWGEALAHYEDAKKEFPGRGEIAKRAELARMHLDVARRYSDTTFLRALQASDVRQALDLYGEVLLKIQTHYVHEPDWQQFVDRGARSLDVALTEPEFFKRYYGDVDPQRLEPVRAELRKLLSNTTARSRREARDAVGRAANLVWQRLRLPAQAIVTEYACAVGALDPYSSFLTAGQLEDVFSQIEGNFVGLGIEIKSDEQSLLIMNVIPGGPAARGGLVAGDRIVAVDQASMQEVTTDEAAEMLKGAEGSTVELTLVGENGERRHAHLRRERVEVPSVIDVKIIDREQGVGYLRITSFQKTTTRDVDAALWQLHRDGMRSLIIDVRGNPGGLLNSSVEIADKFVSAGTIVSTRGRNPREDYVHQAHAIGTWRVPLIVLIDGDSASASEIFAGAIHDHRRGTVVGQQSYGKGSVQGIFPLTGSDAGVRLTTAKFYSPSGQAISDRGVSPNVVVRSAAKPVLYGQKINPQQDPVLKAGMDVARQQLSQR
jgi:carboxyl-terminal processing protease